jgi:predicted GTPase
MRGFKRPILVVANKADNPQRDTFATEFYGKPERTNFYSWLDKEFEQQDLTK